MMPSVLIKFVVVMAKTAALKRIITGEGGLDAAIHEIAFNPNHNDFGLRSEIIRVIVRELHVIKNIKYPSSVNCKSKH